MARHGTETGYRRHLLTKSVPCRPCTDAHAVVIANWRARSRVVAALEPTKYQAARIGLLPAEALQPGDRDRLVAELIDRRWTVVEIAVLTRMTTYTTGRIVSRLSGSAVLQSQFEERAA